ncbi:outer membrane lipoprotein-sorting protein [Zeimonas arvi]|uniref:Outer membrane lipoprotein-sorting protein n=1 Tax=Zeimonas arvi TaxID=2498847 RepID=A0A5C8P504_9BURK|nr:outer membrane lipoprotein-sorting protein [Zeimonas arvi]TXL68398.1 outer membrane lipoprotein-sorting protein [Zeimonas arvi]
MARPFVPLRLFVPVGPFAPRRLPVRHRACVALLLAAALALPSTPSAQDVGQTADSAAPAAAEDADTQRAREIVARADEVRFPKGGFQVDIRVSSTTGGEAQEPRLYRVLSKGNENTIIQTVEPVVERGQNLLMRGRELWIYMPTVSQPVRLSLSQRLTGQVANGDLARANFSGDYTPTILRTEKIGGHDHHVLELKAAERGVTYPKVLYWVRADNGHPHKAEFYALSGRLLKTCVYEDFRELGGQVRPTRLVMTDALKPGDVSVLEYSDLERRNLPDRMFTKDYMKRLE